MARKAESADPGAPGGSGNGISPVSITDEMRRSYLDYAMSVIVARALPDVRDGLKPVQRRILYAMHENGYAWNRPYRKSARVVGEVMGKYHPHSDQAIYDALVRMAQEFAMRLPLIDGQGNFGSVDGDMPASMRYTEVRLVRVAQSMLEDLERDTVDFRPNYDGLEKEPEALPALLPNLLVNGAGGIAVGMATNIPPHNPGEVIAACLALLDDPDLPLAKLVEIIPGPDFPTGGIIMGRDGIAKAYETGHGSIPVRARVRIEEGAGGREAIIADELPYQVNKAALIEKIAEMVRSKRIEGISALRDESDREGMRVVIEVRRDSNAAVILNQLWHHTALQTSFGANMLALHNGRPRMMTLREMLTAFLEFREEVVLRRTRFALRRAQERAHILVGLSIAVANIDEVIALIRKAKDAAAARAQLMARDWPAQDMKALVELIADPRHKLDAEGRCRLSEAQAKAILDLRLNRLTALGRDEITAEMKKLKAEIEGHFEILRNRRRLLSVIRAELKELAGRVASPRRTEIGAPAADLEDEDMIQSEDMIITVTHGGYIKRVALSRYRAQRRGGKGRAAMKVREEDFASTLFFANTLSPILFFSTTGLVYRMKTWRLPLGAPGARGKAMVNLLPLGKGEAISSVLPMPADPALWEQMHVVFATRRGKVRRNKLSSFERINRGGKIAMKPDPGDAIVGVALVEEGRHDILLTSRKGQCVRFPVGEVRIFSGRTSSGVRGISLAPGDEVIGMSILDHVDEPPEMRAAYLRTRSRGGAEEEAEGGSEKAVLSPKQIKKLRACEQFILTISRRGYGKRTSSYAYRTTRRGGKGIGAMIINKRNGDIVSSFPVKEQSQIMLITESGQAIRCFVNDIRIAGRKTQGVKVFNTEEQVVSVTHLAEADEAHDSSANGAAS